MLEPEEGQLTIALAPDEARATYTQLQRMFETNLAEIAEHSDAGDLTPRETIAALRECADTWEPILAALGWGETAATVDVTLPAALWEDAAKHMIVATADPLSSWQRSLGELREIAQGSGILVGFALADALHQAGTITTCASEEAI